MIKRVGPIKRVGSLQNLSNFKQIILKTDNY